MFIYKDLGNIINKENRKIREGMFIRSSDLYALDIEDTETVLDLGIKKVIDLRTVFEAKEKPDAVYEGVTYLSCPLFEERTLGITRESQNNEISALMKMPYLGDVYRRMLSDEYSIGMISKVLHEIMNAKEYPVLFHCTAGKDRTGVIAFFILYLLDVDYEVIIDDYLATNAFYVDKADRTYRKILEASDDPELAMKIKGFWMVRREYLEDGLSGIIEKYGSIDDYIEKALLIDKDEREAFKRKALI
ncbi:MAG: tyrosine-protein phosphatase [Erysipelotrichaceae bacterium]|nr:tyrosine-protein phosphatase [Erysipelotrichaceae bacterium]